MLTTTLKSLQKLAMASVFSLSFASAAAATLSGEVVSVSDGDTVTVLDASKMQHKVRLAGIDAPEKRQAFGDRSRQNLAALVFRKQVVVDWEKTDRYGRIIGVIAVEQLDAGLEQIRAGLAWHYKQYEKEQPPRSRTAYAAAEDTSRKARIGIWSQPEPIPPWDYRKSSRSPQ